MPQKVTCTGQKPQLSVGSWRSAANSLLPFFCPTAYMPKFVVSLRLPALFNQEFMALIPSHWALIQQLIEDHVIETYAISADRTRGWITINAADEAAVQAVVEQFPLYSFLTDVEIDELFIFDSAKSRFPRLSLN
jgi:hypothetical protein